MKTYLVTINAQVSKTIPIQANSIELARSEAANPISYELHDMDVDTWHVVSITEGGDEYFKEDK